VRFDGVLLDTGGRLPVVALEAMGNKSKLSLGGLFVIVEGG
jgi:hypothetical protein